MILRVRERGQKKETEREEKGEKGVEIRGIKNSVEKRNAPSTNSCPPKIEGHGDKKAMWQSEKWSPPHLLKKEIGKGEKRSGGRGECHQKRSGGIRSEREFTTLFLCAEPAGLEITNVSWGRAPAVSRGEEEEEEKRWTGGEERSYPAKTAEWAFVPLQRIRGKKDEEGGRGWNGYKVNL